MLYSMSITTDDIGNNILRLQVKVHGVEPGNKKHTNEQESDLESPLTFATSTIRE